MYQSINLSTKVAFTFLMLAMLGACSVSEHMQVTDGITPENVDKQVRFRTTYYFRVFDSCINRAKPAQDKIPMADALYRFRMTGKANAATQKIRFESGTLKAQEIDPFGATIEWDEENGRPYFLPSEMANNRTQRMEIKNAIDDLIELKKQLKVDENTNFNTEIDDLIKSLIKNKLIADLPSSDTTTSSETVTTSISDPDATIISETSEIQVTATKTTTTAIKINGLDDNKCPTGYIHNKGFQIMGPEGFRTFDQDERLILAMSASGKPLLGAMKELAGRYLKGQPAPNAAERLLPLTKEELRISEANRYLDNENKEADAAPEGGEFRTELDKMFESLIKTFGGEIEDE